MAPAAMASMSPEGILFFRVIFVDGVREIDLGPLPLVSSLGFRTFKATITERIGVSPRRISLSLVCLSPPPAIFRERRIAINERTDFFAIAREQDCFVLAALCRGSRARRGRGRSRRPSGFANLVEGGRLEESAAAAAPEIRIPRRRGSPADRSEMAAQVCERMDVRERQPWLRETAPRFAAEYYESPLSSESPAACAECDAAEEEGRKPEFHCCVHDEIVAGFSRRAPPIARPSKERSRSGPVLVDEIR